MFSIKSFFSPKKHNSPDVLGVYPEHMQVRALPERRYMKTSRVLAIFILICIGFMIAIGGLYIYLAERVDVSIANNRVVNLFSIDSGRKVLVPSEHAQRRISALELMMESLLRDYIYNRHRIVWDNSYMQSVWDVGGPIAQFSHYSSIYQPFRSEADAAYRASRANGFVRDVHLYEFKRVQGTLWEGVFDTFDLPIPDPFDPICGNCQDNSKACLACKESHAFNRNRYKVLLRASFNNNKTPANPLGLMVYSYNILYVPIRPEETFWDVPRVLKPDL